MNGDIDNNQQRPIVASVGNAWVICNSKSRPGFKYYFNTVSGQAVWNLSPEEIEKAKRYTKALPISEIEKCPEPSMDPPMDAIMNQPQAGTSRIYSEPFVRGQIPNQIPNIFPMGLLNVNSVPGVPNISGLNPVVWSNPPNNQGIAQTPVIYVAYPQMNFQQPQEYPQSFPTHIKEEINSYRETFNSRDNDIFNTNNKTHDARGHSRFAQRNQHQKSNWDGSTPDLRQKLIRKRTKSLSSESASLYERDEKDYSHQHFHDENQDTGTQMNTEETSKYDLSVLEQIKTPHSRATHWFIVVDTDILLKNFAFLDKITDPDQDCYLLVPDHVMRELHERVTMGGDVQTRRILRFLSQQIEAELAFKGEDMARNADDDGTYKMLATCEDLAEQNNVILLSNDVKYQRYKNGDSNVHVLTLNELKQVLNNERKQPNLRNKSPTLAIKIVVPNKTLRDVVPTRQMSKTPEMEVRSLTPKNEEIQTLPVPSSKPDKVQIMNEYARTQASEKRSGTDHHTHMKTPEPVEIAKRLRMLINDDGKKEIKLSRSISKANSEGTQTKYRWRKRRNSSTKSKEKAPSVGSDRAANTVKTKHEDPSIGSLMPESSFKPILQKPISPSIDRSSISSIKDTNRPNIVIEETSTSGVISNTTLDSDCITPHVKLKKTVSVCDDVNFEMFSVVGQSMEEVLRIRKEEWVLRFVQIMEDTLKEILRAGAYFQSKCCEHSPMWAADLPELARCIIKKYSDHFGVVDAANRLSFKLQKISISEGGNIEPQQYMDMYSFGVYLIKSLKNVTVDCEDLNTADESLKKLLYDIQNANLDTGHNDNFADELNESAVNATKPANSEKALQYVFSFGTKEPVDQEYNNMNTKGSLLPTREEIQTQINKEPQQQHLKIMETKFFSSLALAKRTNSNKPSLALDFQNVHSTPTTLKIPQTPPQGSPSPKTPQNSPSMLKTKTQDSADNNKDISNSISDLNLNAEKDNIHKNTSNSIKTCFVRNFNSIPQFEEKLNKKRKTASSDGALMDEDYVGDNFDDAAFADGYYDQNELYSDNELEAGEIAEDLLEFPKYEHKSPCQQANNEKFEWFIKEFTDEITRTVKTVLILCSKFVGELKSSHEPSQEIKEELRTACASLSSIKIALNSLLDSESTTPENNIILLLKKAHLDDYVPGKELLLEYRNIVRKCGDQVNTCHDKVTLIMQVAGIQQRAGQLGAPCL